MRRTYLAIALMVTAVVLAGLGSRAVRRAADRRFHSELADARKELDSGLVGTAQKRLTRLAAERPSDPEVAYLLGGCEASRGRFEAALDAWARVPADAPQAAPAALDFAQVAIQLGRVAQAERVLRAVVRRPGPQAPALRRLLLIVMGQQGRTAEAGRLLESLWDDTSLLPADDVDARLALLREHVGLDFEPFPLEFNLSQLGDTTGPPGAEDQLAMAMARAYLATPRRRLRPRRGRGRRLARASPRRSGRLEGSARLGGRRRADRPGARGDVARTGPPARRRGNPRAARLARPAR